MIKYLVFFIFIYLATNFFLGISSDWYLREAMVRNDINYLRKHCDEEGVTDYKSYSVDFLIYGADYYLKTPEISDFYRHGPMLTRESVPFFLYPVYMENLTPWKFISCEPVEDYTALVKRCEKDPDDIKHWTDCKKLKEFKEKVNGRK